MSLPSKFRPPLCPRCRYDQSGDVMRWSDQCPLTGLCPECGLRFEWREVFNGSDEPEWWVEKKESSLWLRGVRTLLRALWPVRFWKRIRLEFDGHLPRSVRILLILLGCFYLSEVLATAAVLYDIYITTAPYVPKPTFPWKASLWPFHTWNRPNTLWLLFYAVCFPLVAMLLPQTRRRAKVACSHLARVFVYATSAGLLFHILATIPISLLLFVENVWVAQGMSAPGRRFAVPELFFVVALMFLAIVAFSWWFACRRYLRLEHPSAVAIALTTIALLTPFTVLACIETISRFGFYQTFFG